LGQQKIRELAVTQGDSYLTVDLIRQDVSIHRVGEVGFSDEGRRHYSQAGVVEIPFLKRRGEPLFLELEHFVECVQARSRPLVSGSDGLNALNLVFEVRRAAGLAE
jgi:predicted dehydrogenase